MNVTNGDKKGLILLEKEKIYLKTQSKLGIIYFAFKYYFVGFFKKTNQ